MKDFIYLSKLGDDSKKQVMEKKILKLHMNEITQVFIDVYYLSGLKNNLLSIDQLIQKCVQRWRLQSISC